jgi:hypothetical protein
VGHNCVIGLTTVAKSAQARVPVLLKPAANRLLALLNKKEGAGRKSGPFGWFQPICSD